MLAKKQLIEKAKRKGFKEECRVGDYGYVSPSEFYIWMCLLQKWLRKEHKIDVQPVCRYKQFRFYHLSIIFINKEKQVDTIIIKDEGMQTNRLFDSYEEALEKGLTKALSK